MEMVKPPGVQAPPMPEVIEQGVIRQEAIDRNAGVLGALIRSRAQLGIARQQGAKLGMEMVKPLGIQAPSKLEIVEQRGVR